MAKNKYFEIPKYSRELEKENLVEAYVRYFYDRTIRFFIFEGLPKTIPAPYLMQQLQTAGAVFITKANGALYSFTGGQGGVPDAYYRPTIYTIANPALNFSGNFEIGKDGVRVRNDSTETGLLPLISKYATLLAENVLSFRLASIWSRANAIITADDDRTKDAADQWIKNMIDGKPGAVAENPFFEGIKAQPLMSSGAQTIQNLIELQQYIKASFYNEIGLNCNYNMKREAINSDEAQMNGDALLTLYEDMFENISAGMNEVNELYGTNITVRRNDPWQTIKEEQNEEPEETEPEDEKKEENAPDDGNGEEAKNNDN